MNTLSDYHKKVLGISLTGKASVTDTINTLESQLKPAGLFCFLCKRDDFDQNKELVLKILSAANVDQEIVFFDEDLVQQYKEVFTFDLKKEKALNFESFSEISKNPALKKKLWNELKKRSVS